MDIEETLRGGLDGWKYREPPANPRALEELHRRRARRAPR